MVPDELRSLFWEVNVEGFDPARHPEYTIFRVLEYGDGRAVDWLRLTFTEPQIKSVIRTERRLSRKSANFWALVYGIPAEEVAALRRPPDPWWNE